MDALADTVLSHPKSEHKGRPTAIAATFDNIAFHVGNTRHDVEQRPHPERIEQRLACDLRPQCTQQGVAVVRERRLDLVHQLVYASYL